MPSAGVPPVPLVVVALIEALNRNSARLEAYILQAGLVKSNTPAPEFTSS